MDFECAAIKTLFYDFPIELASQILEKKEDFLQGYFSDITRWRESAFTVSEWKMLESILNDEWLGKPFNENYPQLSRAIEVLGNISKQLLLIDQNNKPRVQFKQLFRWRAMSKYVGEDTLSLAFVAQHDLKLLAKNPIRSTFLWGDILHHDNEHLNSLLDEGMSDVHSHLNATADVFHLNWISLMNSTQNKFNTDYFGAYQETTYYPVSVGQLCSRRSKCIAAIFLREMLFQIFVLNKEVPLKEFDVLKNILESENYADIYADQLQGHILSHMSHALHVSSNDYVFDYAIQNTPAIAQHATDIDIIYHGERNLLYQVFLSWFNREEKSRKYGSYFYLYLLLRANIRREYVETNILHGFENFEYTQNRKVQTIHPVLRRMANRIIVQSAIGKEDLKDYLETRIAPSSRKNTLQILSDAYNRNPITDDILVENIDERLSFVVHFLKKKDDEIHGDSARYATYRQRIRLQFEEIMDIINAHKESLENGPSIVGIDVAGSELKCRPEVYGHLFRYAANFSSIGRTYHVGEDFYDLVDGLRAIDEAIVYLQLDSHSRIGHALALSVDANEYYKKRHYKMLIHKQALLDNCVWLYYQAKEYNIVLPGELELYLQDTAIALYSEIGYKTQDFTMLHYRHSMLLRSDEKKCNTDSQLWQDSAEVNAPSVHSAAKDEVAKEMLNEYMTSIQVKENGDKACIERYPDQIVGVVSQIQKAMIREIAEKGIAIECCPSSNVMIGGFNRYDKHPIFTFKPIEAKPTDPIINVSINTDDRGIFATNIRNEYSLITLAMMKMKDENGHRLYNDETIYNYIERVRANGMIQRFKTN